MTDELLQFGLLFGAGLAAGIINTLAGGGSLLTLPVLIFMGLPPHVANGTNRIGIVVQALIGSAGYRSKGLNPFPFALYLGISAFFGALVGAQIAVQIEGELFNRILAVIMLIVVAIMVFKPKTVSTALSERRTGKHLVYALIGFFFIGIYGGFINAGIGFVIMLFLNQVNRLDLVQTNATKVALVFIYSLGALGLFAYNDAVNWSMGAVLAFGTSFGAWWSSRWSVQQGEGVIRAAMIVMVTVLSIKLWFF